jgi:acyl-coenzyme A synthetase/AMP-(fatty) acid ligase/acyl carrier protein
MSNEMLWDGWHLQRPDRHQRPIVCLSSWCRGVHKNSDSDRGDRPMRRSDNLAGLLAERSSIAGWYDKPAFYAPHVITHGQVHEGAARLAHVLGTRGLSSGDRVLLCLSDSADLVQVLLACLARGVVVFLANPDVHREEHAFQERDVDLLVEATGAAMAECEPVTAHAPAYATYTSGTTGAPRAAIHRHADPLTFVEAMCGRALMLSTRDIGLSSARMYFAYGLGNSVWFPLATGGSAIINNSPVTAEAAAEQCRHFKPSVLYGVPTFFSRIVERCSPEAFESLRCLVSAGEALTAALGERLLDFFGDVPILDGIGSTEVGQTYISNSVNDWRLGTLGKVLPPYETHVVADDGALADPGVEGNLWVRGPSITPGYWNRPAADLPLAAEGWLDTRDRVSVDGDGWVNYRCRADDIENVGGININPRQIEAIVAEDGAVAEAAVVAVREGSGASVLQAFLVPGRDAAIDESVLRGIHQETRRRLSSHKVPHRFVVVEQLPRTTTGKLLRNVLRAEPPTTPLWQVPARATPPEADTSSLVSTARASDNELPSAVSLSARLDAMRHERYRVVTDAVRAEVANMLGQPGAQSVNPDVALSEQGFDSQMAVELRNRLSTTTGLQLPDTIVWDYGTAAGLARYLEGQLSDRGTPAALPVQSLVDEPVSVAAPDADESVVIVGMGCRFPGGVGSAEGLWGVVA